MIKKVVIFVLTVVLTLSAYAEDRVVKKTLKLDADSLQKMSINCGAGFLKIKGIKGLKKIKVEASIVFNGDIEKDYNNYIELSLTEKGQKAVLKSDDKQKHSIMKLASTRVVKRVDLEVQIPSRFSLKVDDGSGSIKISNVEGDLKIDDGSGSMEISEIGGTLKINDGSGGMQIDHVKGDINIDDGSGSLTVNNVGGNVVIDDGSGSIKVRGVNGDVKIIDAGSGSVSIKDVKGKVKK